VQFLTALVNLGKGAPVDEGGLEGEGQHVVVDDEGARGQQRDEECGYQAQEAVPQPLLAFEDEVPRRGVLP